MNDKTIIYPASKQEDLERFLAAGERLVREARQDKAVAEKFLRDIGYYDMMEDQRREEEAAAEAGAARAERKTKRKTARLKPLKPKVVKDKR